MPRGATSMGEWFLRSQRITCPETSVNNHATQRDIPEDLNLGDCESELWTLKILKAAN